MQVRLKSRQNPQGQDSGPVWWPLGFEISIVVSLGLIHQRPRARPRPRARLFSEACALSVMMMMMMMMMMVKIMAETNRNIMMVSKDGEHKMINLTNLNR